MAGFAPGHFVSEPVRAHPVCGGEDAEANCGRKQRKPRAGDRNGGCRGPGDRPEGLGERRKPRGRLAGAEVAARGLLAEEELDRSSSSSSSGNAQRRGNRPEKRKKRECRDERRERDRNSAQNRLDL